MNESIELIMAVLRMGLLAFLMGFSIWHKDWLGIFISFGWATSLVVGTLMGHREIAGIIAGPLLAAVVWYIIKAQRERFKKGQ